MKNKIHISFLCIFLLIAILYFAPQRFPALILTVTIHELGHLCAAKLCKIKLRKLKLGILGAAIIPHNSLFSYKKELILSLGGPAVNIICALLTSPFANSSYFLSSFYLYSVSLAILNLFPIKSFDGGRILYALLTSKLSPKTSEKILNTTSFILIFILWSISIYLLIKISSSISLYVFSISIFSKIFLTDT